MTKNVGKSNIECWSCQYFLLRERYSFGISEMFRISQDPCCDDSDRGITCFDRDILIVLASGPCCCFDPVSIQYRSEIGIVEF